MINNYTKDLKTVNLNKVIKDRELTFRTCP